MSYERKINTRHEKGSKEHYNLSQTRYQLENVRE